MTSDLMPSGPCAYCGHAPAHHRDLAPCTECVKDRQGGECYCWIASMADRNAVEAALRVKEEAVFRKSQERSKP